MAQHALPDRLTDLTYDDRHSGRHGRTLAQPDTGRDLDAHYANAKFARHDGFTHSGVPRRFIASHRRLVPVAVLDVDAVRDSRADRRRAAKQLAKREHDLRNDRGADRFYTA